jgi:hypothetical protein
MFDESAITYVFSGVWKSVRIHNAGNPAKRDSNRADTINLSLETHQFISSGNLIETSLELFLALPVEINVLLENSANELRTLSFVPVTQFECLFLVQEPDARAYNIFVGTHQKPQLVEGAIAVIDLLHPALRDGPEQLTQFPRIDLIGLRSMEEQSVLERIADENALYAIDEFQIQPMGTTRFLEGDNDAAFQ